MTRAAGFGLLPRPPAISRMLAALGPRDAAAFDTCLSWSASGERTGIGPWASTGKRIRILRTV
jgi:hypothetical protein